MEEKIKAELTAEHENSCLPKRLKQLEKLAQAETNYNRVLHDGVENYIGQMNNSSRSKQFAENRNLMFNPDRGDETKGQVDDSDPEYTDGWVQCSR